MAILDIQRRLTEVGRIRIGEQVPIGKSGKTRPAKLETFRLTSPNRGLIETAATLYGGQPRPWTAPAGPQYEVITEVTSLPVIVPPVDIGLTQWMELWSGGGCQRRCNTNQCTYIDNGNLIDGECLCDPDNRECKPHTRLSVMLRNLPDSIGLWRLDTQGWNAALELLGAAEILEQAARRGIGIDAELRLDQRMIKRPGQPTRRFAVPVLNPTGTTPGQLLTGVQTPAIPIDAAAPRAIDATTRFSPVPTEDTPDDTPSIAEQAAARTPRRTGGQAPIPRTGIQPRTAPTNSAPATAANPTVTAATIPNGGGRRRPTDLAGSQPPGANLHDSNRESRAPSDPASQPTQIEWPQDNPPDDDEPRLITPAQLTKLSIQLNNAGLGGKTDEARQARHDFCAAIIGRPINSAKDLTLAEAGDIIDILENNPEPPQTTDEK